MATNDTCVQCGSEYKKCVFCKENIILVPTPGFGNSSKWRHVDPPKPEARSHEPHPKLHIT